MTTTTKTIGRGSGARQIPAFATPVYGSHVDMWTPYAQIGPHREMSVEQENYVAVRKGRYLVDVLADGRMICGDGNGHYAPNIHVIERDGSGLHDTFGPFGTHDRCNVKQYLRGCGSES